MPTKTSLELPDHPNEKGFEEFAKGDNHLS